MWLNLKILNTDSENIFFAICGFLFPIDLVVNAVICSLFLFTSLVVKSGQERGEERVEEGM